ncbi:MAG: uracil-DNA glycosylase [Asticcacaulis sp.]
MPSHPDPSRAELIRAELIREWESYLSFLSDHDLEEVYDDAPHNRLLAENKSRSAPLTAQSATATVTPLPGGVRVNALRPETLKNFNLDLAVASASAIAASAPDVNTLYAALENFPDIPLRYEGGKGLIRGRGHTAGGLLIVGDIPDADEDEAQEAFAGKAGRLTGTALDALGLKDTTTCLPGLFWRPTGGRPATDEDIRLTTPFTRRLIELLSPRAIVLCGATAVRVVLESTDSVQKLRGTAHSLPRPDGRPTPVFVTFPPALLLRQPLAKKAFWADLLLASDDPA